LRDGGWVLVVAALLVLAFLAWAFAGVFAGHRPIGGGDVASYGFDLSTATVPEAEFVATGQPRDFLRPLVVTEAMPVSAMVEFNRTHRKRYVVGDDRVIGVTVGGASRAYPLSVVEAHEVVEDTLGGIPIAVTYSPFCDSVVVFDRRLGDRTVRLGVSGLVRDANTLLHDHAATPGDSSLWQQIDGRALAGPAAKAGTRLERIPGVIVTTWNDWLAARPDASVMRRDEANVRLYQNISYRRAHESTALGFPVDPLPEPATGLKDAVLVLDDGTTRRAYAIDEARRQGLTAWAVRHGDRDLVIDLPAIPGTARLRGDLTGLESVPCFWFAAHASLGVPAESLVRPGVSAR
jgi:hypothetical protein